MKLSSEPIEQFAEFGTEGLFRPGDELAPVAVSLLPDGYNHVQLGVIGWQIAKDGDLVQGETE